LAALTGYNDAITTISTRLSVVQTTLGRVSDIGHEIKGWTSGLLFDPDSIGQTTLQKSAQSDLAELLGLLNTQVGDQYIFSGRDSDKPAVETVGHILDGDGLRAGLRQLISERALADLGASGLGRVLISTPTATSVQVAEDAVSPFGLKLAGIATTLTGSTVTAPAGTPAVGSIDLGAVNPNAGETVTFTFNLPDGTSESVTLTATSSATPGPNEFTIGATSDVTASNLQGALTAAIGKLAKTSLLAASAVAVSSNFFAADAATPPQRVSGPPFDSATALVAGTAANTVIWYTGEVGGGTARSSASARIDSSLVIDYGTRANEQGIQWVVQNVATLAAISFPQSDPNAHERSQALNSRLLTNLDIPAGIQKVENIEAELATTQNSMQSLLRRHKQMNATLSDFLGQIEGVSNEMVGAQILALQTRLQASLQTTALLYQTSLVNFIR
jgi:flagellin-like hook-associated protein FlgL